MTLFLAAIVISALVFLRVYGPHLVQAVLESWEEEDRRKAEEIERIRALALAAFIVKMNEDLAISFGTCDSRTLEMPLEIDVEYLDSEFALILEDDTLTTSQALVQINELFNREAGNA